jgi:hypothetical protein
MVVGNGEKR